MRPLAPQPRFVRVALGRVALGDRHGLLRVLLRGLELGGAALQLGHRVVALARRPLQPAVGVGELLARRAQLLHQRHVLVRERQFLLAEAVELLARLALLLGATGLQRQVVVDAGGSVQRADLPGLGRDAGGQLPGPLDAPVGICAGVE